MSSKKLNTFSEALSGKTLGLLMPQLLLLLENSHIKSPG